MALFESYDRREPQILAVLKNYGIGSVEECAENCKAKGLTSTSSLKAFSLSASKTLSGLTQ